MSQLPINQQAVRLTEEATRRTVAYSIRLFALSRCFVSFMFGIMLVPLQASIALGKVTKPKAAIVKDIRKSSLQNSTRPDLDFLEEKGIKLRADPIQESLLPEFRSALVSFAKTLKGKPYRIGGKRPATGFDCSGFTGYVFRQFGINLPHCSRSQSQIGQIVPNDSAKPGDLVFFGRKMGKKKRKPRTQIYHTGIIASNEAGSLRVIHSATGEGVVVTDLSRPGYWRNHLVSVRRVIQKPAALVIAQ